MPLVFKCVVLTWIKMWWCHQDIKTKHFLFPVHNLNIISWLYNHLIKNIFSQYFMIRKPISDWYNKSIFLSVWQNNNRHRMTHYLLSLINYWYSLATTIRNAISRISRFHFILESSSDTWKFDIHKVPSQPTLGLQY